MSRRDRQIEIVFQSIKQRRGQVQMHGFGDWRSYRDPLGNSGWAQPGRTRDRRCLLAKSRYRSPDEAVLVARDDQTDLDMLGNNRRHFAHPCARSSADSVCQPSLADVASNDVVGGKYRLTPPFSSFIKSLRPVFPAMLDRGPAVFAWFGKLNLELYGRSSDL